MGNRRIHVHCKVVGSRYRLTIRCDHERAYRYLLSGVGIPGLSQAELHKDFVTHGNNITALQNKIKQIRDAAWSLR